MFLAGIKAKLGLNPRPFDRRLRVVVSKVEPRLKHSGVTNSVHVIDAPRLLRVVHFSSGRLTGCGARLKDRRPRFSAVEEVQLH